ncbi:hypothetical protein [Pedobacter sp. JCM 36344]|uniref:hypothetical protein n=1 Tax=Pedobacter sp. JCM 36344 TaxID=3374280 RepID=UPI003978FC53
MLYTKQQLETLTEEEKSIASKRYLYKVHHGDVKKLLPHECEFVSAMLPYVYTDKDLTIPKYDIYQLSYCADPLFKRLVLTYLYNLDFLKPVSIGYRNLDDEEIVRDRAKFDQLLAVWELKLEPSYSDAFLHEVKIEYYRKIKILEDQFQNGMFGGRRLHEREILKQKLSAFYIYSVTRSFFRSHKSNYVAFQAAGSTFSVNIYSYVHIASRHYIPDLNGIGSERSFNSELICINPFNLPYTVRDLIVDYFDKALVSYLLNQEYMIFSQDTDFYIIWWKHKRLTELNFQMGYEIRTLYKIEAKRDKDKINHNNFYQVDDRITYFY